MNNRGINNLEVLDPNVPECVQIANCGVTKVELRDGTMLLSFIIPGIKRFDFLLDRTGRKAVAALCSNIQIAGPEDMPKGM